MKILVPVELPPDAGALFFALGLREILDGEFLLLHVVPSGEVETFATLGGEADDLLARKMREAAKALEGEVDRCRRSIPDLRVEIRVASGIPFREICRVAEDENCQLITIATHGRRGVSHLLLGSTAERVVQHASCPVLSFKPAGKDFPEGKRA